MKLKDHSTVLLRKWIIFITLLLLSGLSAQAAKLKGRAIDENGVGIGFATAVMTLQSNSSQRYGISTDSQGDFSLTAPFGKYQFSLSFIGYETITQDIELDAPDKDLGALILKVDAQQIESIEVRGQDIRREIDRFVINVANMPLALGKNATELLSTSPGVWIEAGRGVSINGKSGTQVMVNERLLRESGAELVSYLNSIRAEDIQKIEVVPITGADQDANKTGGLIKITLKKQRTDGVAGSVSLSYNRAFSHPNNSIQPSANIRYRQNRFSLYSRVNYRNQLSPSPTIQEIQYNNGDHLSVDMYNRYKAENVGGQLGGLYDISDEQIVGLEVDYTYSNNTSDIRSDQRKNSVSQAVTDVLSLSDSRRPTKRFSITANYRLRLDTLGSEFKLLLDYNNRDADDKKNHHSHFNGAINKDTLYRSAFSTINNIYSIRGDFNLVLSARSKLGTGFKYNNNGMNNSTYYEGFGTQGWYIAPALNSLNDYRENIGALYVAFSTQFSNNIAIDLGLRGEYTYAVPSTSSTVITEKQDYFGLFPTVSVSFPMDEKQNHELVLSYARKIQRPSFWDLNPWRYPISEYAYVEGNPLLTPAYMNDASISYVFMQQYNLTMGVDYISKSIDQVSSLDPQQSDLIIYRQENVKSSTEFYANLNLPFQLSKWWRLNANITGGYMKNIVAEGDSNSLWRVSGNATNTFTLIPKKSFLEIAGWYQGPAIYGNIWQSSFYQINIGYKHILADNRFVLTAYVNDIFNTGGGMKTRTLASGFVSYTQERWGYTNFSLSFTYNFKAGKQIRVQRIESGANEEKGRLWQEEQFGSLGFEFVWEFIEQSSRRVIEEQPFISENSALFALAYTPEVTNKRAVLIIHPFAEETKSAQRTLVEMAKSRLHKMSASLKTGQV